MNIPKKIAWEKWMDDEEHQTSLTKTLADEPPDEDEEDIDMAELYSGFISELPTLVSTPIGVYKLHDRMSPTKQFDCWMAYTNFDITDTVKDKIESIDGVEVLIVLTRYRFFLGVAKLFSFRDVRISIEKSLCDSESQNNIYDEDIKQDIDKLKLSLSKERHWAIFVFPNGEIDHISTNDKNDDEYLEKLIMFNEARTISGGIVIQSDLD